MVAGGPGAAGTRTLTEAIVKAAIVAARVSAFWAVVAFSGCGGGVTLPEGTRGRAEAVSGGTLGT